jgi:hypothetical protein
MKEKLKAIYSTLQTLSITTTYDNMNKLLGCLQALQQVYDELSQEEHTNVESSSD